MSCNYISWFLDNIEDLLVGKKVTENSAVSVARFDGLVVASTAWNSSNASDTVNIYELDIGFTNQSFQELASLVDFDQEWHPVEVRIDNRLNGPVLRPWQMVEAERVPGHQISVFKRLPGYYYTPNDAIQGGAQH